jgi:hypothetical protein
MCRDVLYAGAARARRGVYRYVRVPDGVERTARNPYTEAAERADHAFAVYPNIGGTCAGQQWGTRTGVLQGSPGALRARRRPSVARVALRADGDRRRRTQTFATSQPAPEGAWPRQLGILNGPIEWAA